MTLWIGFSILIPAVKKEANFQDDLVKKLSGLSPVQRSVNKAKAVGFSTESIHLFTDSDEIRLIGERNCVSVYFDPRLRWDSVYLNDGPRAYLKTIEKSSKYIVILSPYAPLLSVEALREAAVRISHGDIDILKPVQNEDRSLYSNYSLSVFEPLNLRRETYQFESKAFSIVRAEHLLSPESNKLRIIPWPVASDAVEIRSLHDWWVCEKLLQRQRIVFRVIGNSKVGMGHIYRALSIAHELTDHEVLFVSDSSNQVAVNQLAGYDYWVGIFDRTEVIDKIIQLNPDLVINDMLDSELEDVLRLQKNGTMVVGFEDLGSGAIAADLTINELYDVPKFDGGNVLWGHDYFFVRAEFDDAKPNEFNQKVTSILLTFGGTDQHDLSRRIYLTIKDFCREQGIAIHIVTGPGYENYDSLSEEVADCDGVSITHGSGVISGIMEKVQLAITSNGRTVFELAHMNVPGIVIAQHAREDSHTFACPDNGFVPLGIFNGEIIQDQVLGEFKRLATDDAARRQLFGQTIRFNFNSNKSRVTGVILDVLGRNSNRSTKITE